jgi:hypothetical protein
LVERKSLLGVQAVRKGKAPNCSFPFTCAMLCRNCAMRFGGVARVLLSPLTSTDPKTRAKVGVRFEDVP